MTDQTETLDTTTADEMPDEPGLAAFIRARIEATAEQPELPPEDAVDEDSEEDVPDSGEDQPADDECSEVQTFRIPRNIVPYGTPAEFTSDEQADYAHDAQWLQDNWDNLRDDEMLEVSVGGMRLFLRERLAEALSEPAPYYGAPSDHEEE